MKRLNSIIEFIMELDALKDSMIYEIKRPVMRESLKSIYEIKSTTPQVDKEKLLRDYQAKDLLELIRKIRGKNS
ncbi:hypothetical protein [Sulfurisphaera ohwakuensis]|uniref:Uncharacterized protein n=1 Tax=Sulfurisphaera ohwakuensis TaxID=69656 RepID=A0A7J9RPQ7_SULOH|nr:hypothetical protein [Sulfurisphaera ohwakuensis]MBB5252715.1 hypothetical protein [Sulfurisphaera ohwakuensis]